VDETLVLADDSYLFKVNPVPEKDSANNTGVFNAL